MVVGKTYKDVKDFDVRQHKRVAREFTKELDMRTRTKPLEKKERGGGKNWRLELDDWLEEDYENKFEEQ
jgi:hypothetical protein